MPERHFFSVYLYARPGLSYRGNYVRSGNFFRMNNDGTFDQTFTGPGASVSAPGDPPAPSVGRDVFLHLVSSGLGKATAVTTQPNGKIIIVGSCLTNGAGYTDLCLTKLNADGSLDVDFNGDGTPPGVNPGRILVNSNEFENGIDIVLQPNGDFVVLCTYGYSNQFCVYRFSSGGTIDSNFYAGSAVSPSVRGRTVFGTAGQAVALAITPSGSSVANRLLALGDCSGASPSLRTCSGALNNSSGGSFDGTVDPTLIGPNGDGAGSFNYHLRTTGGAATGTALRQLLPPATVHSLLPALAAATQRDHACTNSVLMAPSMPLCATKTLIAIRA